MTIVLNENSTQRHTIARWRKAAWQRTEDDLAEEVPVALEYNGISHAVMLATPADLEEFALGFSLSEGIVPSIHDVYDIEAEVSDEGVTLHLDIANDAFVKLKERRRNLTGRTGCGLCGTESLGQVMRILPDVSPVKPLATVSVKRALSGLAEWQPINRLTGATHAAAWANWHGELLAGFEDVGRHNALDKLIGALARQKIDMQDGFVVMTSRASVELVQKAATLGISALVAISAPTSLAVRTAQACGMTLVAFARGEEFVAYANIQHIKAD